MTGDFILRYIMTTGQKNNLINLLEVLLEDIFKNDTRPTPTSSFEKKVLEMIYFEIEKQRIGNNSELMEKFLNEVLEETKAMPELKMTIAVSPTEELIEKLKDWTQANGLSNVTFDIEVDPQIIAGAVIITPDGRYIRYALSEMLDRYFLDKKQEISQLL